MDVLKIPCYGNLKERIRNIKNLISKVKTNNYDFILLDGTWVSLWISVILKRIYGIPVILRLRGDPLTEYLDKKMIISYVIEKFLLKKVDIIITVSEFLKKKILSYGIDKHKVYVLNTPILNESTLEENKRDIFTFVTAFSFKKKIALLPAVINKIAQIIEKNKWNFKIFVIGEGKYRVKVMDSINPKWKEIVVFPGYSNNIKDFYRRSKIFFHFSLLDAFPSVILEALSFGVPVIVNKYGPHEEMIKSGENGFIVRDYDELEKYVTLLVNDDKKYNKMSKKAIESVKKWHPEILSQRLREILLSGIQKK